MFNLTIFGKIAEKINLSFGRKQTSVAIDIEGNENLLLNNKFVGFENPIKMKGVGNIASGNDIVK